MRALMVLGGPRAGEWWGVADHVRAVETVETCHCQDWLKAEGEQVAPHRVTYVVWWAMVPGWRIPLPFLVHPSLMGVAGPGIPKGTVLPGAVLGDFHNHDHWPIDMPTKGI